MAKVTTILPPPAPPPPPVRFQIEASLEEMKLLGTLLGHTTSFEFAKLQEKASRTNFPWKNADYRNIHGLYSAISCALEGVLK